MSCQGVDRQGVDLYRRVQAALNARDVDALVALCDPDVEICPTFSAAVGGVYHRHDGVRAWQREIAEIWGDDVRLEVEAYFDLGEQTMVMGVLHGRGARSGAEVAMPAVGVATWRDGLLL
jgi:ketosteroid isomerase-like protein